MSADNAGVLAARSFSLLRGGSSGWRLDAAGFWSYPALTTDGHDGLLWLFIVLQAVPMPEKKRTALFRPKAIVVTRVGLPEVVRYENLRTGHDPFPTQDWEKPIAMFPHKSVAAFSYDELEKREAELLTTYAAAGRTFLKDGSLPASFAQDLLGLMHPAFLPYIRHLAPQFFAALGLGKS